MKKKSQIKFGESIGVIFIVFFVIMTGLIWYNNINQKALNDINKHDLNNRAFEKYYYIKELNLIHISQRGIMEKELDLDSLIVMSNFSKTKIGKKYLEKRLSNSIVKIFIFNNSGLLKNEPQLNLTLYNGSLNNNYQNPIIFISYFPVETIKKKILIAKLKITSFNK